ncbi:MAG: hypothetical protein NTV48_00210 [Candidatus Vogelbacteria bacterium]|nr:hypothetical protein [Candidatus Vogelbacteria bacterium]
MLSYQDMGLTDEILFFLSQHPGNYRELRMRLIGNTYLADKRLDAEIRKKELAAKEKSFRTLLSNLKKRGLVTNKDGIWEITSMGQKKNNNVSSLPKQNRYPKIPESERKMIIAFDIPDLHKTERYWLRVALINLGFVMIQKSVWFGPAPLPHEFIKDLKTKNIHECFKFFEVKDSDIV